MGLHAATKTLRMGADGLNGLGWVTATRVAWDRSLEWRAWRQWVMNAFGRIRWNPPSAIADCLLLRSLILRGLRCVREVRSVPSLNLKAPFDFVSVGGVDEFRPRNEDLCKRVA